MKFWLKKGSVPLSNETKQVDEARLWAVRWTARYSDFSAGTMPVMRVFPSKIDAEEFAQSLKAAFKLIQHTSGDHVYIEEML